MSFYCDLEKKHRVPVASYLRSSLEYVLMKSQLSLSHSGSAADDGCRFQFSAKGKNLMRLNWSGKLLHLFVCIFSPVV